MQNSRNVASSMGMRGSFASRSESIKLKSCVKYSHRVHKEYYHVALDSVPTLLEPQAV